MKRILAHLSAGLLIALIALWGGASVPQAAEPFVTRAAVAYADELPDVPMETDPPPDQGQACNWAYKLHYWQPASNGTDRIFESNRYRMVVQHRLQTARDRNDVCQTQIRNTTNLHCYYMPGGPTGPTVATDCTIDVGMHLALKKPDGSYYRVPQANHYFEAGTGADGITTLNSRWTNWSYDCWLPTIEKNWHKIGGVTYNPSYRHDWPINCKPVANP